MTTARNEPCPCGSGKKYKKCCMKKTEDPVNYTKQKLDRFHEGIVGELMRYAATVYGPEAFYEARDEFLGWPEGIEIDEEGNLMGHESVFYPWFLFKWRIESEDGESSLPGPRDQSIVQAYLQAHGRKLDPLEREYLEAQANAPLTFFQIMNAEPGKSVSLRDLLLDRDYLVLENTASRMLHSGDVVFGSAFEAGGIELFGALGPVVFNPSAKVDILSARKTMSMADNGRITPALLDEYDLELRNLYFKLFAARTAPPALCNTDGEMFSLHSLKYAVSSPQKVFDALKELTNGFASEEELLEEAEYDANGDLLKVEIPWLMPSNAKHAGMENTVHGRLIIDGSKMTCEVNSAERAERLRMFIEKNLPGGEAVYKTTVIQSAEAMMREPPPSDSDNRKHEDLMNHPEIKAKIEQMMRKHWEAWPDMEIPALQGKTPRQAVRDDLGRRQVSALLEDAEKNCRESNGDLGSMEVLEWVRRELGL